MPQLNPTPWFWILLVTWLSLFILFTKILQHQPKLSTQHYSKQFNNHNWTWPWS
nr:ATP synthase F0 subunit 8 [Takydromus septentrionalis]